MRAGANRRRSGHTLIELIVSVAVSGILVVGLMSTLYTATRATDPAAGAGRILDGSLSAHDLLGELQLAVTFLERSANAVTFTVADRNGDTADETIRYAWSGTPGDPLTRQYNGGAALEVLQDVHDFTLTYDVKVVTEQPPPVANESGEVLLAGHDTATSPLDYALTKSEWIGQYFQPSLTLDAIEWRVTRVTFKARIHGGAKGITAVQLRLPTASNLPGTTVLEEVAMDERNLAESYLWEEFPFSSVGGMRPSQGLCLVLALIKDDAHLADVQYDDAGGAGRLTTASGGSSWSSDDSKAMVYAIYGTVTSNTQPDPVTREWLRAVGVKLCVGPDSSASVQAAVQILNAPEVTAP